MTQSCLGFIYARGSRVFALFVAATVLVSVVICIVIRRRWWLAAARTEEIKRFLFLAAEESARADLVLQMKMKRLDAKDVDSVISSDRRYGIHFSRQRVKRFRGSQAICKECFERNVVAPSGSGILVPCVVEVCPDGQNNILPFKKNKPESYIEWKDDELTRALREGATNYDMDSEDEIWLNKFNIENNFDKPISAKHLSCCCNNSLDMQRMNQDVLTVKLQFGFAASCDDELVWCRCVAAGWYGDDLFRCVAAELDAV